LGTPKLLGADGYEEVRRLKSASTLQRSASGIPSRASGS
jgi:hypothetical protein